MVSTVYIDKLNEKTDFMLSGSIDSSIMMVCSYTLIGVSLSSIGLNNQPNSFFMKDIISPKSLHVKYILTREVKNMSEPTSSQLEQLDQEMIELARKTRVLVVNQLTKNGTEVPKGQSEQMTLMQAVDGLDKQAFSKAKLKLEEKEASNKEEINALLAATLSRINVKKTLDARRTNAVTLDMDVELHEVPGETEYGVLPIRQEELEE